MTSQSGQSVLECLLISTLIITTVLFCLSISLIGFSKSLIQHLGYQTLICYNSEPIEKSICKKYLITSLKLLPYGQLEKLTLSPKKIYILWKIKLVKAHVLLSTKQKFNLEEWI